MARTAFLLASALHLEEGVYVFFIVFFVLAQLRAKIMPHGTDNPDEHATEDKQQRPVGGTGEGIGLGGDFLQGLEELGELLGRH
jgi:hypothetical protein